MNGHQKPGEERSPEEKDRAAEKASAVEAARAEAAAAAAAAQDLPGEAEELPPLPETLPADPALLEELAALKREKRDRELSEDKTLGALYGLFREEVLELTEFSRERGVDLDPEDAFHALLVENFPRLLEEAEQRGAQRALRSAAALSAASPSALGGSRGQGAADYGSMNDEAFDRLVQRALRGELRSRQSL